MSWQQGLVVAWLQFALSTAVLLGATHFLVRRLREPAERARIVPLALTASLAMLVLPTVTPWPAWNLGWVEPFESTAVEAPSAIAQAPPPSKASSTPPTKFGANELPMRSNDGQALSRTVEAVATTRGFKWAPWSLAALCLIVAHGLLLFLFATNWLLGRRRLNALCRASSAAPDTVAAVWNGLDGRPATRVKLLTSERLDAPLVFGCWRPTVIVPAAIARSGDVQTLRYCLAHERSHIERGDLWSWALIRCLRIVFWYQPAYWSLARELRLSQELLADHRSWRAGNDPIEYSELLMRLAKSRLAVAHAGALNMLDQPSQLGRRIRLMLDETMLAARCRWRVATAALATLAVAVSLLSAIHLGTAVADEPPQEEKLKRHLSIAEAKAAKEKSAASGPAEGPLTYNCIVVEKETNKPIAGATVKVRRSDTSRMTADRLIQETTHTTDDQGRYSFTIPPDQVARPRLYIELDVEHPDYSAKKGFGYSLAMIRKNEPLGERPFFERTALLPAEPVVGVVLSPDGAPLAGVKIQSFSRANPNDWESSTFSDTKTDADGKFRMPLVKGGEAVVWVLPNDYAIVQRYLGQQRGDLGTIQLEPGIRMGGRVLDVDGKPVPNVAVNAHRESDNDETNQLAVFTSVRRAALTDADGRFEFAPLPAGDYQIVPEEHLSDPVDYDRTLRPLPAVFVSQKAALKPGLAPVEIQAVPHVVFEAQYYNSQGEKTNGHEVTLWGKLDGQFWHGQGAADQGHIEIRVPHGLQDAHVQLITNEHSALRYRLKPGGELNADRSDVKLDAMNDDVTGFEIIRYVAPIVLIKAVDEQGKPIEKFSVFGAYPWGDQRYILDGEIRSDITFEKQQDGRYRSSQVLPDEELTFTARAEGYEDGSEKVKLPEADQKELTLILKKKPADANAAKPAETQPAGAVFTVE